MVALAYLNRMGGRVPELSRVAERIHSFALDQDLTISAEWIPTGENLADGESRIEGDFSETRLNPRAFELIQERFGSLEVDLFATGDNVQTPVYVSLKADPGAWYVDAFSRPIPSSRRVFANPPFILIPRLLAKVKREKAQLVLLAPVWRSQPWWPVLIGMLTPPAPLLLPQTPDLFLHPRSSLSVPFPSPPSSPPSPLPPLFPKWQTIACRLSGNL